MQSLAVQILLPLLLAAPAPAARPAPVLRSPQQAAAGPAAQKNKALPVGEKQPLPTKTAPATIEHDYGSAIAEYENLSPDERQRYVEHLITVRLQSAAQLTLDDAALRRERDIDREILTRLADGQTISPRGLVKLLRKLDSLEHAAVESLSRSYRVEVYSLFHSQRQEYDLRIAAWKKVEGAWEAHGKVPDQQRQLIDWLRAATDRLRADRFAQLPAMPKFSGVAASPQVVTAQPTAPRLADARPNRLPIEPPKLEPAPTAPGQRHNSSQLPDLGSSAPNVSVSRLPAVQTPAASPRPPLAVVADAERPPAPETKPLVKQSREVRLALKPAIRPADPPPTSARTKGDSLEPQAGKIDLDELSVRIAGHNLALARLSGRLQDGGLWTLEQLSGAVADLEDLTARRGDLMLYWELIGEEERASVGSLQASAGTITLLGAKISSARVAAIGHHGDQPTEHHDEHAAQFDSLSRRLAQLVGAQAKH